MWGPVDHVRRAYRCLVDREHELRHGRQQGEKKAESSPRKRKTSYVFDIIPVEKLK